VPLHGAGTIPRIRLPVASVRELEAELGTVRTRNLVGRPD
jgi:hypothetical protein